jgi:putative ABC transport system substrate-binding protein
VKRRELMALLAGAMACPLRARAQQKFPVIGFLSNASPVPAAPSLAAFRQGLGETGYVEGQNLAIEYRGAEGRYDGLPAMAARPGGNLTGLSIFTIELISKRFALLAELVPQARSIALLVNPNNAYAERVTREVQEAARAKGMQLHVLKARGAAEFETAFAPLVQLGVSALFVSPDAYFISRREELVALAARHAVPAIYEWREFVTAGGLISYGTSLTGVYHQIGIYAGKILKGAKPGDLPVQQPTKFELVINLKTAKALGLIVPPSILARADEVIE